MINHEVSVGYSGRKYRKRLMGEVPGPGLEDASYGWSFEELQGQGELDIGRGV